jgi:hypothetical protein
MGHTTRSNGLGGSITDFWPDDTAYTLYFESSTRPSLAELLEKAQEKWGKAIGLEDLLLEAEHIQTHCLGYDRYDPSDYTEFLVLHGVPKA